MNKALFYAVALSIAIPLHSAVIRVDHKIPAGGNGSSWQTAFKHLQDSLAVAATGDEIWVTEGSHKPDEGTGKTVGDREASFALVNGVRLYGGFKGTETTRNPLGDFNQTILSGEIDGNQTAWSFHVVTGVDLDSSTVISGFRITKGNANGTLLNAMGGGIFLEKSSPKITHCFVTENSAAFYGGGIYSLDSSPSLANSLFARNSATYRGGGIYFNKGQQQNSYITYPSLANCVFSGNSATRGGGLYNDNSSPTITNCIIFGNTSAYGGGGIYGSSSSPLITNCTFADNSAENKGGAIYTSASSSATMQNSIFFNNASGNEVGHGINGGWSNGARIQLVIDEDNPEEAVYETVPGTNNLIQSKDKGTVDEIDADPLFTNPGDPVGPDGKWFTADDGLQLAIGSPAINTGSNNHIPNDVVDLDKDGNKTERLPVDMSNFKRVQGDIIDLGPYEHGGELATPPPIITINVASLPSEGGTVSGGGPFVLAETTFLVATPSGGFLFLNWSGDATGTANPLAITVTGGIDVVANFVMDENDDDGDGLSNYVEQVTHGTKIDDNDTDNDGLLDNVEVQIETEPNSPNTNLVEYINAQVTANESSTRNIALAEGQAMGIAAVKARPSDYALYDAATDLNASVTTAIAEARASALEEGRRTEAAEIKANQAQYGIFDQSDVDEARASALTEGKAVGIQEGNATGIAAVEANPSRYGLYTFAELSSSVANTRQEARNSALEEGLLSGIAQVKERPNDYDLITVLDLNKSVSEASAAGIQTVVSTPSQYSLFTQDNLNAAVNESVAASRIEALSEGRAAGVSAVKSAPSDYGLAPTEVLEATGATPYTNGWYYRPQWGWLWTNSKTFPYIFLSSTGEMKSGWIYFREGSSSPTYFFSYSEGRWITSEQ
jgi:predicted outer membrane repeat protein